MEKGQTKNKKNVERNVCNKARKRCFYVNEKSLYSFKGNKV